MKILIIDTYKNVPYRISKDTSGGYGTGNDFGNSIFTKFLKKNLKKIHDWPPMFAVYTLSVLSEKGHDVDFLNELPDDFEIYDLFIITSSIVCCETEIELIKKIKKRKNHIFAIGPFATNKPKIYFEAGATVISGEPEFYFLQNNDFFKDLSKELIFINHNYELDDLPFPKWKNIIKDTKKVSMLFGNYSTLPILATRGCPYSCFKYCVYPLQQGRKVRQRSPKKIVDEMEYWKNNMNIQMFVFRDPVFSINKKHTLEFAEELINRKLNLKFIIETHLRILDKELISILKRAGLKGVKVGVESADAQVLIDVDRFTIKKDAQYEKIRELEQNKIQVSAMYILGFPSDTETSMSNTINYAKKLNTTYAQFSVWTPYPGTPIFEKFKDKIFAKSYEQYDQYNLVYDHENLNEYQIREWLEKAYENFYIRFGWFKKFILSFC
ncbi:radical SAM protein [Candidatus Pelagibacter sp.]|nr:radical SAM protein [Candidatus Pelagibacter sp.]